MITQRILYAFGLSIIVLSIFSCTKDLTILNISNVQLPIHNSTILSDWTGLNANSGKTTKFTSYTISPAKNLTPAMPVRYIVEMDLQANNFSAPVPIITLTGIQNDTTVDVFVSQINAILLSNFYATVGLSYPIQIRERAMILDNIEAPIDTLVQSIGDYTVGAVYIDPSALTASHLTLPGGYASGDWNPADTNRRIYSLSNDNRYQGFNYFDNPSTSTGFKFAINDSWALSYGESGSGSPLTGKLTSTNGNDIKLPAVGYYFLTANLNSLLYTATAFTAFEVVGFPGGNLPMTPVSENGDGYIYGNLWQLTLNINATDKIQFQISGKDVISGNTVTFLLGAPFASSVGSTRLKQNGEPLVVGSSGYKTIILDLRKGLYQCTIQ